MARLLLVEDNEANRDMLGRRLARAGHEVSFALDAVGGVAAAQTGLPDLILMDIGLGEIDGWEAVRRLKADPATAAIPVIALTAHAMASDRERAFVAVCADFDTKPVDFRRLTEKIARCLGGPPQAV
jgi:two-component system cell cycle response regulator DivK